MNPKPRQSGFTLVEILIVVAIIGLILALAAPRIIGHLGGAKRVMAAADVKSLSTALELYALDNNRPPTTEQGLAALVKKPDIEPVPKKWREGGYLKQKSVPKDPWGNEYIYISPGLNDPDFDIISYGADGMSGGDGDNADIESWNLQTDQTP
ncbi:type II secretion system major pseudopilin GspG [bacterium]|nr:type II secretion system major pseudopilin GspG [bacterium]